MINKEIEGDNMHGTCVEANQKIGIQDQFKGLNQNLIGDRIMENNQEESNKDGSRDRKPKRVTIGKSKGKNGRDEGSGTITSSGVQLNKIRYHMK